MTNTKTYVSLKDTAAQLRKALRAGFPGVKFSVRSDRYSGGASIHVTWTDGPGERAVDKIAQQYAGARFDGMTDTMSYVTTADGTRWAADFVFTVRNISDDAYSTALAEIIEAARAENYPGADELLTVHRYSTFLPTPVAVWKRTGLSNGPVDSWVHAWTQTTPEEGH